MTHHVKNLVIFTVDQRQLELELSRIDVEHTGAALSIQAVDVLTFDPSDVDGHVQGADDTVIAMRKSIK